MQNRYGSIIRRTSVIVLCVTLSIFSTSCIYTAKELKEIRKSQTDIMNKYSYGKMTEFPNVKVGDSVVDLMNKVVAAVKEPYRWGIITISSETKSQFGGSFTYKITNYKPYKSDNYWRREELPSSYVMVMYDNKNNITSITRH